MYAGSISLHPVRKVPGGKELGKMSNMSRDLIRLLL